ncbi:MAG: bifunctional (p)ppGpp synthetase/guanosine-3',5'-bis(diphosphate) 3'-pyrophosphohydrolase [Dehalococcoidales bacterium]|nr:bifunctional (p)ppGpp synthetase/guanosine-3',5'-bis(diphosphate) 3'-pyrophosphohydrolase [Dehalococcoidales bacterium]MDD4229795.1 bifunctional (p)ppGpp synthetase/guanosine-3',5'-bis(diphosphate) 3'-pyrophosphohydrolase [Dehalococcoidales bacterium]MDD4465205.1 bifunctional (p)ppGpp synthetase/guanosine-3',5'-bis(diphosphate) 3'-pyrophosphohydrolase [Dehalococcoidales bacterium]
MVVKQAGTYENLIGKASRYIPAEKLELVKRAYEFAREAHRGQMRLSGEAYLNHPLQVALILAELQFDSSALAAALLHDTIEDCGISLEKIKKDFGFEIANLVDGTTKLEELSRKSPATGLKSGVHAEQQAENLRKLLVAMAEDLRVVFIKLADRLHNMRTLSALPAEKKERIARETLEIYAPLAHRLGVWELKWELEDLSFRYLEPEKYSHISKMVNLRRTQREVLINQMIEILRREFEKAGLKCEVTGRPKHLYSIHQKIQKYETMGKRFDDIQDLLALRVLVNTVPDCYNAIGVVHSLWHPMPGYFDDYIANPKANGYQSLHTAVMAMRSIPLEVQIRTYDMHHFAEYGVASHWRYKEGEKSDEKFEEKLGWLRQLVDWHRELTGAEEFLESVKTDIFNDQVFVFTPKGEIKDLPQGATPVDFAYRIHTDLGHRCIGAKVNGRLVPLNYQLKNGEVVEIVVARKDKTPSRDWLNPNLGYVRTSHAREKLRQFFKRQERAENIDLGRNLLEKEIRRLGLKVGNREEIARIFHYDTVDDFLAAVGYGGVSLHQISMKLASQQEAPKQIVEHAPAKRPTSAVRVLGAGNMLTSLARCCNPVPGDAITGYITRNKGVTVHRSDCHNIVRPDLERERLVEVDWGQSDSLYPVRMSLVAWDRVGLVRDFSTVVAGEKINITSMTVTETEDGVSTIDFTLSTSSVYQLSRLINKLEGIKGVVSITRTGEDSTSQVS